jgi:hypothetical protein
VSVQPPPQALEQAASAEADRTRLACRHNQPSGITALLLTNEAGKDGSAGEPVLVTACNDCALKLWRMPGFEKRGILAARVGHSDIVRCLARVRASYHSLVPALVPYP